MMPAHKYITITPEIATEYNGFERDDNTFFAVQAKSGDWVCAKKSLTEFPEAFETISGEIEARTVTLDDEDFDYSIE